MKYLRYIALLGIILSLSGCSSESEESLTPLSPESESETLLPVGVEASSVDFVTRADDSESMIMLKEAGFIVWGYSAHVDGSDEMTPFFTDNCIFNLDEEKWQFEETHKWPDKTSKFDFFALSPGFYIQDEEDYSDKFVYEGGSLLVHCSEYNFDNNASHDLMLATSMGVDATTNAGNVSFSFKHILTKVTLMVAFNDELDGSFLHYCAQMILTGKPCTTYNVTSGQWLEEAGEEMPLYYIGDLEGDLSPTPAGSEWVYGAAGSGFVLPEKYLVEITFFGYDQDAQTECGSGTFELDLSAKAGYHVIVMLTTTLTGDGSPNLKLVTTDEYITAID